MSAVVILFVIGIFLVAIEVVVPGGLCGFLGGSALLAGVAAAFFHYGPTGGFVATGLALAVGSITIYLEFVWLPKSRFARALSMNETVAGRSQPEIADSRAIVGQEAVALTTLAPTGYVEVDGRRYEASCESGLANVGEKLRVLDVDTFRLVVTRLTPLT
ncbi:MAG TPA: NfeD family protein [Lacunisphaera sp.]|jgi:membrane-bound ClpP family serine protease